MYKISKRTLEIAKQLKVNVKFSHKPSKKIDVFDKDMVYICSIGDNQYKDYHQYLEEDGAVVANKRRELYKKRHAKDINRPFTRGFYAYRLLWC